MNNAIINTYSLYPTKNFYFFKSLFGFFFQFKTFFSIKSMRLLLSAYGFIVLSGASAGLADPLWRHNGSVVKSIHTGDDDVLVYVQPTEELQKLGVRPGDVLFYGSFESGGTASIFSLKCGAFGYQVIGSTANSLKITLTGSKPRINPNSCETEYSSAAVETLTFDRMSDDGETSRYLSPIYGKAAICTMNEVDAFRKCVTEMANAACAKLRGAALYGCFVATSTAITREGKMSGYAEALMNMGIRCNDKVSHCNFFGGGAGFYCRRLSKDTVKQCEGNEEKDATCAVLSCPIRTCRIVCSNE